MKNKAQINRLRWGLISLAITLIFILAACAPQLATAVVPTTAPAPAATQPVSTPSSALPTAQPTTAAEIIPATGGLVTYKIVPGESKVTYEVGETFINQNNRIALAVGVTDQVSGEIYGDKSNPAASRIGPIEVNISLFKSDSGQRDNQIRRNWLESTKYPTAKFVPTQISALPAAYQEGQDYTFQVTGDLTIKQTTKPATFTVTTRLTGDTLTGKASTELLMSNYGVGPISILGVLNTEDKVKLTFDFVARP